MRQSPSVRACLSAVTLVVALVAGGAPAQAGSVHTEAAPSASTHSPQFDNGLRPTGDNAVDWWANPCDIFPWAC